MSWFSDNDAPQVSQGVVPAAGSVPDQAAQRNLGLADSISAYSNANGTYSRPLLDNANSTAARVGGVQADTMDLNRGVAQENLDFQNTTFRPLQRGLVADAVGYDTPGRREQAAGLAMANTGSQIDAETEANNRSLASRGVDPSSGASLSLARRSAVMGGAAKAAAGNQARLQVEQTGVDRRFQANTLGNQLAGNAATASQLAVGAGSAAVNTAAAPLQLQSQQTRDFTGLASTGAAANTAAGGLMKAAGAGTTSSGGDNGTSKALGALAGAAASYYGGKAKGGKVGLADMHAKRGLVNLDVGEFRIPAKVAAQLGSAKLKALNEGRATVVMKRA